MPTRPAVTGGADYGWVTEDGGPPPGRVCDGNDDGVGNEDGMGAVDGIGAVEAIGGSVGVGDVVVVVDGGG